MGERDVRLLDERMVQMEREICNMMTLLHQEQSRRMDTLDERVYDINARLSNLMGRVKTIGAIAGTITSAVVATLAKLIQSQVK